MFDLLTFPLHFSSHTFDLAAQVPTPTNAELAKECISGVFSDSSAALTCGGALSKYTASQWDAMWAQKIGSSSPEFLAMLNISRYIAGPAVALWGISAMKSLYRNGIQDGWQQMASIIILVLVLYGNGAAVTRNLTLAARSLINYQNEQVLALTNQGFLLETKIAELTGYIADAEKIKEFRSQCIATVTDQELVTCLENANVQAQSAIDDYASRTSNGSLVDRLRQLTDDLIESPLASAISIANQTTGAIVQNAPQGLSPALAIVQNIPLSSGIGALTSQGILAGMTYLAANIIETAWLFTAIVVPIPLALAFYPGGVSALIGWAVGFLSLGLFKINMNVATSIIVSMLYEREPSINANLDLMLMSLGVIVLALGMTAGGGFAIFNGIMTGVSAVTLGIVNMTTPKS